MVAAMRCWNAARMLLPELPEITSALADLQTVTNKLQVSSIGIDLADLRGYHYHSGMGFGRLSCGQPRRDCAGWPV